MQHIDIIQTDIKKTAYKSICMSIINSNYVALDDNFKINTGTKEFLHRQPIVRTIIIGVATEPTKKRHPLRKYKSSTSTHHRHIEW